ncbi:MAG: rod shape-determining protein MreC [Chloroflexi bacterium]|nr:rod shape-determining protein MreC [Chloroflexota bacterium]MYI82393.1 rod shape-determining protein MreC [Chloroflexota bacterium]
MAVLRHAFWLIALLTLAGALLAGSRAQGAAQFEERGGLIVAPLIESATNIARSISDAAQHGGRVQELSSENAALRQQIARLEGENARLRESVITSGQLADLRAAAGAEDVGSTLAAGVVLRDPAPGRDVIVIDRGARDGVRKGQAVLGSGATLIGLVSSVQDQRARVRLLSDPQSAIAAVVQSTRTQTALTGSRDGLRLEFAPIADPISEGDLVMTSALIGGLPGGLLAGLVTEVDRSGQDLFADIKVEPLATYERLEHVLVITEPSRTASGTGTDK